VVRIASEIVLGACSDAPAFNGIGALLSSAVASRVEVEPLEGTRVYTW